MCTRCPSGKISSVDRLTCDDCPAGTTTFGGFWRCEGCHQGTHAPAPGATFCAPCPAGTMSEEVGTRTSPWPITNCTPCPVGQAATALKVGFMCTQCHAPWFTHKAGALRCLLCGAGSVKNVSEATGCTVCAAGTYQSRHASQCLECTPGTYSQQGRSNGCDKCSAGTFTATPGSVACAVCTPGSTSNLGARWCSPTCTDHTNEVPAACLPVHDVPVIVRITSMQLLNFTLERQTELRKRVGILFKIHHGQVQISETHAAADGTLDVQLNMSSARHRLDLVDTAVKQGQGQAFSSLDFDVSSFEIPPVREETRVPISILPSRGHTTWPSTWAPIAIVTVVIWNHVTE